MSQTTVLDGAMGSVLLSRGLKTGTAPDEWNLSHPAEIRQVHREYREAGARILTTNTFGSSRIRLTASGLGHEFNEINRAAVDHARRECRDSLVAGDIGPTGLLLEPLGELSKDEAGESFRSQAQILNSQGIDLFILETFFSLDEGILALEATRTVSSKPIWISLTFRRTKRGFFTMHGDEPSQALSLLLESGATKVGANCTLSSMQMRDLARQICPKFRDCLFFQPNAGEPLLDDDEIRYPEAPPEFAANCIDIIELGACAVGGCCGSTPAHVREIISALNGGCCETVC